MSDNPSKIDLSQYSYTVAESHHFSDVSGAWKNQIKPKLKHPTTGESWKNEKSKVTRFSCATRLSLALYKAGVRFPEVRYVYKLSNEPLDDKIKLTPKIRKKIRPEYYYWTRPSGAKYPSNVADFPKLLQGGEILESQDEKGRRDEIQGRKGVVYFKRTGIGHITLWDGEKCHFEKRRKDHYFNDAVEVIFWKMKD